MISQDKQDKIFNALTVGMALTDAYVYAGLTEAEITEATDNVALQTKWHSIIKGFEFSLLSSLNEIAHKQARVGREGATVWMLEKMFPRYSSKPQPDVGEVHLHFNNVDPTEYDTVEVFNPDTPAKN